MQILKEEREEVLAEVQIKIDKANEEAKKAKEAESKARIELNKIKGKSKSRFVLYDLLVKNTKQSENNLI